MYKVRKVELSRYHFTSDDKSQVMALQIKNPLALTAKSTNGHYSSMVKNLGKDKELI